MATMEHATPAQLAVLRFISEYLAQHGWPPSIRDISEARRISSASAYSVLLALERKGLVAREPRKSRTTTLTRAGKQALR